MRKYELTPEVKIHKGVKLHRIKALRSFEGVKAGDLGGYVQSEANLSHEGNSWVYDNAFVYDNARIFDNARICNSALISGNAFVFGGAKVYGDAWVYGDARICGSAKIYGNAWVYGNTWVCGDAEVCGGAEVYSNAEVYGNAEVCGNAKVCGKAEVCRDARVYSDADYICFKGLGSQNRNTTFFKCQDGHVHVSCGCFNGAIDEFEQRVKETHGDSKFAKEYLACLEVVKIHFGGDNP